jgi:hypothetical protein
VFIHEAYIVLTVAAMVNCTILSFSGTGAEVFNSIFCVISLGIVISFAVLVPVIYLCKFKQPAPTLTLIEEIKAGKYQELERENPEKALKIY